MVTVHDMVHIQASKGPGKRAMHEADQERKGKERKGRGRERKERRTGGTASSPSPNKDIGERATASSRLAAADSNTNFVVDIGVATTEKARQQQGAIRFSDYEIDGRAAAAEVTV